MPDNAQLLAKKSELKEAPLSTLSRIRDNVDYTEKKQMPKFAQILFHGQEIALKTSA